MVVTVCLLVIAPATRGTAAAESSGALRARAYQLAYDLKYEEASRLFQQAIDAEPDAAANHRGLAAITWLNIAIFERGSASVDDYLGRITQPNVKVQPPPPELAARFERHIGRALELSEQMISARPRDPEAHYQLGASVGVLASYQAVVEGKALGAFRAARRAYLAHTRVLNLDPRRKDAALVVGSYRYVVSALSLPVRLLAYVVGFDGGREEGLRLVEEAAAYPGETQAEARFLLVLLYNREKRFGDAFEVLAQLQRAYPRNRFLWLNEGVTALRAGHAARAERALLTGLEKLEASQGPQAFGERALWRLKLGLSRVQQQKTEAARGDFEAAAAAKGREWVRGRARLEIARLLLRDGRRDAAAASLASAIALCRADNDPECAREAERLKQGGR